MSELRLHAGLGPLTAGYFVQGASVTRCAPVREATDLAWRKADTVFLPYG